MSSQKSYTPSVGDGLGSGSSPSAFLLAGMNRVYGLFMNPRKSGNKFEIKNQSPTKSYKYIQTLEYAPSQQEHGKLQRITSDIISDSAAIQVLNTGISGFHATSSKKSSLHGLNLTIFGWVNVIRRSSGQLVLFKIAESGTNTPPNFQLTLDFTNGRVIVSETNSKRLSVSFPFTQLPMKTWNMFLVSYDDSNKAVHLFVNGQHQGDIDISSNNGIPWSSSKVTLHANSSHVPTTSDAQMIVASMDTTALIVDYKVTKSNGSASKLFQQQKKAAVTDNIGKPGAHGGPNTASHPSYPCKSPTWSLLRGICKVLCDGQGNYTSNMFRYPWVDRKNNKTFCYVSDELLNLVCPMQSNGKRKCGQAKRCKLEDWKNSYLWSRCTQTCADGGSGTRTRQRKIKQQASHGGERCHVSRMIEQVPCNMQPDDAGDDVFDKPLLSDTKSDTTNTDTTTTNTNTTNNDSGPYKNWVVLPNVALTKNMEKNFPVKVEDVKVPNQTVDAKSCIDALVQTRKNIPLNANTDVVKLGFVEQGSKGDAKCKYIHYTNEASQEQLNAPDNILDDLLERGAFKVSTKPNKLLDGPCTQGIPCKMSRWKVIQECPPCKPPNTKILQRHPIREPIGSGKPCRDFARHKVVTCKGLKSCSTQAQKPCFYGGYQSTQPSNSMKPCKSLLKLSQSMKAERTEHPSGVVFTSDYNIPSTLNTWAQVFNDETAYMGITRYVLGGVVQSSSVPVTKLLGLPSDTNAIQCTPSTIQVEKLVRHNESGHAVNTRIVRMNPDYTTIQIKKNAAHDIVLDLGKCAQTRIYDVTVFDHRPRGVFWLRPIQLSSLRHEDIRHWCRFAMYYKKVQQLSTVRMEWIPVGVRPKQSQLSQNDQGSSSSPSSSTNLGLAAECKAIKSNTTTTTPGPKNMVTQNAFVQDTGSSSLMHTEQGTESMHGVLMDVRSGMGNTPQVIRMPSKGTNSVFSFSFEPKYVKQKQGHKYKWTLKPSQGRRTPFSSSLTFASTSYQRMKNGLHSFFVSQTLLGSGSFASTWTATTSALTSWIQQPNWTISFWVEPINMPTESSSKKWSWTLFQANAVDDSTGKEQATVLQCVVNPSDPSISIIKSQKGGGLKMKKVSITNTNPLFTSMLYQQPVHVAIVRQTSNILRLYLNGNLVAQESNKNYSSIFSLSDGHSLHWNWIQFGSETTSSSAGLGLSGITFWTQTLSTDVLRQITLENLVPSPRVPSVTLLYWDFRSNMSIESSDNPSKYKIGCAGGQSCKSGSRVTVTNARTATMANKVSAFTFASGSKGIQYGSKASYVQDAFQTASKTWTLSFWWMPVSFGSSQSLKPLEAFSMSDQHGRSLEFSVDTSSLTVTILRGNDGKPVLTRGIHQESPLVQANVPSFIVIQRSGDKLNVFVNGQYTHLVQNVSISKQSWSFPNLASAYKSFRMGYLQTSAQEQGLGRFTLWKVAWHPQIISQLYRIHYPPVEWLGGMYHCTNWRNNDGSGHDTPACDKSPNGYYHMFALHGRNASLQLTIRGTITPYQSNAKRLQNQRSYQISGGRTCGGSSTTNGTPNDISDDTQNRVGGTNRKPNWGAANDNNCNSLTGSSGIVDPGQYVMTARLANVQTKNVVEENVSPSCQIQRSIWDDTKNRMYSGGHLPDMREIDNLVFDASHVLQESGETITSLAHFSLQSPQQIVHEKYQSLKTRLKSVTATHMQQSSSSTSFTSMIPTTSDPNLQSQILLQSDFSLQQSHTYTLRNAQGHVLSSPHLSVHNSNGKPSKESGPDPRNGAFGQASLRVEGHDVIKASSVPSNVQSWWTSGTKAGFISFWIQPHHWGSVKSGTNNTSQTSKNMWIPLFTLNGCTDSNQGVAAERYAVNPGKKQFSLFTYHTGSNTNHITISSFRVDQHLPTNTWTLLTVSRPSASKRMLYIGSTLIKTIDKDALNVSSYNTESITSYEMSLVDLRHIDHASISIDAFAIVSTDATLLTPQQQKNNDPSPLLKRLVAQRHTQSPQFYFRATGGTLAQHPDQSTPVMQSNAHNTESVMYSQDVVSMLSLGPTNQTYMISMTDQWNKHVFQQSKKTLSLSCWVYFEHLWTENDIDHLWLVAFAQMSSGTVHHVGIGINPLKDTFIVTDNMDAVPNVQASKHFSVRTWTHVAVTRNSNGDIFVYIDGSKVNSNPLDGSDEKFWFKPDAPIGLLCNTGTKHRSAALRDVHVWTTALSSEKVKALAKNVPFLQGSLPAIVNRVPRDLAARLNTQCMVPFVGCKCQFIHSGSKRGYYLDTNVGAWVFTEDLTKYSSECKKPEKDSFKDWKAQRNAQTNASTCCSGSCPSTASGTSLLGGRLSKVSSKGGIFDVTHGTFQCPSVCPFDRSYCAWSGCSSECGHGQQMVMRQPRVQAKSCTLAGETLSQPCERSPCPLPCPHAFNGTMCFHPQGGTCDSHTGKCKCKPGFTGPSCDTICPIGRNGQICGSNGTCQNDGTCKCKSGYTGTTCEIQKGSFLSRYAAVYENMKDGKDVQVYENTHVGAGQKACGNDPRNCTICWPAWKSYAVPRRHVERTLVTSQSQNVGKCGVGNYFVRVTEHYEAPPPDAALMYVPGKDCTNDLIYDSNTTNPIDWTFSGGTNENETGTQSDDPCFERRVIINTAYCAAMPCAHISPPTS